MSANRIVKETTIFNTTIVLDLDSNNHRVEIYLVRGRIENERRNGSVTNKPRNGPITEGSSFFESCFLGREFQFQDSKAHEEGDRHQAGSNQHRKSRYAL